MTDNENKGPQNPEQISPVLPVGEPRSPVSFDASPIAKAPETGEPAKPVEVAMTEEVLKTPENVGILISGLEQKAQSLKNNFKSIESSFIDIGKTVLESGVFVDEEYTAVNELLGNSFGRYEEIATIINAQLEQLKKLGEDHIKDELPINKLMEKVSALESKLSAHQAKNRSLLDSLLKIKEVLPEKVADSKPEYERVVKQSLKAMSDFSLSYLNTLDIDSVPAEEKDHLNIIFNVYDSVGFADVSKSFVRVENYYLAEAENLKNQEQNLLELYQKDKTLEANKPKDQHLVDENLRGLFLLKDLFDLNPELYKKVILNFQFLDQYKDDLKDLQPYLKMQTGYYDLNFLKKRVLDLAKDDPGMVLDYLEDKLEDLKNAKQQLDNSRVPAPDKPWNNSIKTIKERFAQTKLLDDLLFDLSQVTTIYEPGGEAGWTGAKVIESIEKAKELYRVNKDLDQAVAGITTMLGLREKVKFLLKHGGPQVIVGKGAEEVLDVAELEKAAREISQMAQSGEFRSDAEAEARDYVDMVVREKFPTKPTIEVGEDADIVDEVVELKPEDIEYVDEVAIPPAKPKYDMPPLPAMEAVKQEEAKSAESKAEIAEGIKELKNIELQRQFVENFWKDNKELSDKLQYYQIMYRELKNMADARAGAPVLDDMAANLLPNLNSYIKENYGKKSEAEIIGDVAKQLEDNDEKLRVLYNELLASESEKSEFKAEEARRVEIAEGIKELKNIELQRRAETEGVKEVVSSEKSQESRELSLTKMIAEAQSFDDLAEMIQKNQLAIQGSEKLYKTEDLLASINAAKIGIAPNLWLATRKHGFREKLKSLYDAQRAKTSGEEVIEMSDADIEEVIEAKPVKSTPPPLPPRFQKLEEPEPISLTEDMKKKPIEPEPISLTEDMKKKTVAETPDWRNQPLVDSDDVDKSNDLKFGDLEDDFFGEEQMLPKFKKYERLASLNRRFRNYPEDLEFLQAELSKLPEYRGVKLSKNQILDLWFEDAEKPKDQARDFIEFIDRALASLEKWKQPKRREPPKLPETKFPTLFQN